MAGKSILFEWGESYIFGRQPDTAVTVADGKLCWYDQVQVGAKIRKTIGPFVVWATPDRRTTWYVHDTRTEEVARVNRNNTSWVDLLKRLERLQGLLTEDAAGGEPDWDAIAQEEADFGSSQTRVGETADIECPVCAGSHEKMFCPQLLPRRVGLK